MGSLYSCPVRVSGSKHQCYQELASDVSTQGSKAAVVAIGVGEKLWEDAI